MSKLICLYQGALLQTDLTFGCLRAPHVCFRVEKQYELPNKASRQSRLVEIDYQLDLLCCQW
ncbi:hypothetical protein [Pseudoalteromonas holothuriae]|uniref:hypothetical protein n=2 Tax=Pseudoalteromonas holothuriae TaxID=2963714 RepID=UPI0021BE8A36|nr:hypothetical protein [Pseudoalteromonas sp. CIP111951]